MLKANCMTKNYTVFIFSKGQLQLPTKLGCLQYVLAVIGFYVFLVETRPAIVSVESE